MEDDMWAPAAPEELDKEPLSPDSPALCLANTRHQPSGTKKLRDPDLADPMDVAMLGNLYDGYAAETPAALVRRHLAEMYFTTEFEKCPQCGALVAKLWDKDRCWDCWHGEQSSMKQQERLGLYLRKTIGYYGIERYSFATFKMEFGNSHAFKACEAFDAEKSNVMLIGPCGTGKTHLAGAVMKKVAAENKTIMWANPMFINRMFRMRTAEEEEERLEMLGNLPFLAIDDLGVGRDTEFTLRVLYEIIERRMNRKRNGLFITSNLLLDELARKFGDDRLTSRLNGFCSIYQIDGKDWRGQSR